MKGGLRERCRRIPPLYWLGGLVNYLKFRRELKRENRCYSMLSQSLSPPPMLRYRVHRALDEKSYLENGKQIAGWLAACTESHGVPLDGLRILDFGCGPGRVASELKKLTRSCEIFGSDIDAEAVQWASEHLSDAAVFTTNEPAPPTRYPSEFFDLIYSVSLFTHLDETLQNT